MSSPTKRTETGYQCEHLHVSGLAPRLSQVLLLRALGKSIGEIAQLLGCSTANIKQAINTLFFKLNADSSPELITRAFQNGYLRFLSIFAALFVGLFATAFIDNHMAARISRAPRHQTARVQQRNGNNKMFDIEDNC